MADIQTIGPNLLPPPGRTPPLVSVRVSTDDALYDAMLAIYLATGRFGAVHAATSRAQKRLARNFSAQITAEGWIA